MKIENKVIFFSIFFGMALWIIDAALDSIFFSKGSFLGALITDVPAFEIYIRVVWLVCFVIFGSVTAVVLKKHQRTEAELKESEERLRTITETAKDAILMMDDKGDISFWNPAAEKIFGYTKQEALGNELHLLLGARQYHETHKKGFKIFKETGNGPAVGKTLELQALKKDGTEFLIELSLSSINIKGKWHAIGIVRDITERKKTEEELKRHKETLEDLVEWRTAELKEVNENLQLEIMERKKTEEELHRSEKFLSTVFNSIRDPFSIVDRDFTIIKANAAYAQMRDKQLEKLIGKKCYDALHGRDSACSGCVIEKTFKSGDPCAKDKLLPYAGGIESWVEIYTYPLFDETGRTSHVIEYTRDITDRRKAEEEKGRLIEKLRYLSRTDSLTGLLNRRALIEKLEYEIGRAKRYASELSIILCDMDRFKGINDTYGHAAGDKVLQTVANTINNLLRGTDTAGRYGGDEFMVILPETTLHGAENLAERIRSFLSSEDCKVAEDKSINIPLSLGVTCFNPATTDIDSLVKRADIALYRSKKTGGNKVYSMEN